MLLERLTAGLFFIRVTMRYQLSDSVSFQHVVWPPRTR